MALVGRFATPRTIERGLDVTLMLDVTDELTGAVQTSTAATFTLQDGGETLLSAVAATPGTTTSYPLLPAVTASRGLSDQLLETWDLTIAGVHYLFRRTAYLVRVAYRPTFTDDDLFARHSVLREFLSTTLTGYGAYREQARERIERDLIKRGKRPALIFDSWALHDAGVALSLAFIFDDDALSIGDGRYKEKAAEYRQQYLDEMEGCRFRYDESESGTVDSRDSQPPSAPIILSGGNPRSRWMW